MSNSPEQIKAEIEATRAGLSRDVDALAQTISPANVARRQKEKVATVAVGAKDNVTSTIFGAKDKAASAAVAAKDAVMGKADQAQSSSGQVLHATGEAISSAPQAARQGAQGNPLAAGMIALGLGWLAGSILPATRVERQAADTLKEMAAPLVQEVAEMAKDSAQNLQEPAKEGLAQVKSTGVDALQTVKEESSTKASDVADAAKDGAQNVKATSQSG